MPRAETKSRLARVGFFVSVFPGPPVRAAGSSPRAVAEVISAGPPFFIDGKNPGFHAYQRAYRISQYPPQTLLGKAFGPQGGRSRIAPPAFAAEALFPFPPYWNPASSGNHAGNRASGNQPCSLILGTFAPFQVAAAEMGGGVSFLSRLL